MKHKICPGASLFSAKSGFLSFPGLSATKPPPGKHGSSFSLFPFYFLFQTFVSWPLCAKQCAQIKDLKGCSDSEEMEITSGYLGTGYIGKVKNYFTLLLHKQRSHNSGTKNDGGRAVYPKFKNLYSSHSCYWMQSPCLTLQLLHELAFS